MKRGHLILLLGRSKHLKEAASDEDSYLVWIRGFKEEGNEAPDKRQTAGKARQQIFQGRGRECVQVGARN